MTWKRKLGGVVALLMVVALTEAPEAHALSCAGPPYGEVAFLELERVTEDGVEVTDPSYGAYTIYLETTEFDEGRVRLWVLDDVGYSWFQDFE
jgi:hypothetical protein